MVTVPQATSLMTTASRFESRRQRPVMRIQDVRKIQKEGERLGRLGLSLRVIDLVAEFQKNPNYHQAMILAGRMRVIACAAGQDDYWREQIGKGESREMFDITKVAAPSPEAVAKAAE
jgi:hypothetical protein